MTHIDMFSNIGEKNLLQCLFSMKSGLNTRNLNKLCSLHRDHTQHKKISCTHKINRKIDLHMIPLRIYKEGDTILTNRKSSS